MTDIILGVLHMCLFPGGLFALAVGLLFKGLDRRVEARLQRRVGPPLVQPLLDIAKLLTKETLIPKTAVRSVFLAAPVVGFAGMAVCAAFIPVPGVFDGLYNMGDLLVLFYLLPIPAIAIMLGGSASSSPFGAIGFSREMLMMLAYETPLLMILLAVAMLVGRDPQQLDAHGVARACVESVGENLTDGILATLFWAAAGLLLAGLPGAAALAACHRAANVLDALWGRLDATYRCFGTAAARLDDVLNWCPARLALPCIVLAAALLPGLDARACRRVGWRDRHAHESPNSAWSEAAFAGALGLRLGGPARYGPLYRDHPWLGDGSPLATARHIRQAVRLMWASVLVFAASASLLLAAVACI